MALRNSDSKVAGFKKQASEPRLIGSIMDEMLQGWHPDTHLSVILKTILRNDKRLKVKKQYPGVLRLDTEAVIDDFVSRDAHLTFTETVQPAAGKRNPHVFNGRYITVTSRADGSLHPNFKAMSLTAGFTVDGYAIEVCNEIRRALTGLVEEK